MIKIVIDIWNKISLQNSSFIVRNTGDYVISRIKIRDAFEKGNNLTVIIRNKKIKDWYKSLITNKIVFMEEITPKSLLAEKLRVRDVDIIPYANEEIEVLDLLSLARKNPPLSKVSTEKHIENWIIGSLVDPCWTNKGGTYEHICQLISYYLKKGGIHEEYPDCIGRFILSKKNQWFNSTFGPIYRWFFDNPKEHSFFIYLMFIMRNYGENIKKNILRDVGREISNIPPSLNQNVEHLRGIICEDTSRKKEFSRIVERKLKNVLEDRLRKRRRSMGKEKPEKTFEKIIFDILSQMSGELEGELNAISSFIQKNSKGFTENTYIMIAGKFHKFENEVKKLKQMISPPFPRKPSKDWSWNNIMRWLRDEYFPYKIWLLKLEKSDRKLEEYSLVYSHWLYENYPKLKNQLSVLNYGTLYEINKYIKKGKKVLWIVVDNLSWIYKDHLKDAFRSSGFDMHPLGEVPKISMLPSETKISKYALLAGKLPVQIPKDAKYRDLFEDFCRNNDINEYLFIKDESLRKGTLEDKNIICCVLNELDFSAHRGAFDLDDEIKDRLRRWVNYINKFIMGGVEKNNISVEDIVVIVSTDHGSYSPLSNSRGHKPLSGAEVDRNHRRYISFDSNIKLDENWFFLEGDRFGLKRNFAIIKGYDFVGSKMPLGRIHGGMTPEETFIPHLEFCLKSLEIKAIECNHIGDPLPLGKIERITEISIVNPNDWIVENIRVVFPTHDLRISIDKLDENSEKEAQIELVLSKENTLIQKENAVLNGYYSFYCMGREYCNSLLLRIRVRKLIDKRGTAEELFDFAGDRK